MAWLYRLSVVDGPLPWILCGAALAGILALLVRRRPRSRWLRRVVLPVAAGLALGVAAVLIVNATLVFGVPLPRACLLWVPAGLAGALLGVASLWDPGVWRKCLAAVVILLSLLSAALGVNAAFGIDRTLGAVLGVTTQRTIHALPRLAPTTAADGPLWRTWTPPPGMPARGETAQLADDTAIPSSAGFRPRNATIYLPPAALVAAPPRLPLVVMMMGRPGEPDPTFIAAALDRMAARNHGLAPIVIVADQLGAQNQDPACADSTKYGGVATYVNHDIPAWASAHLNVVPDRSAWTIMGYSNGGACAFSWATHHPEVWGNMVALSSDEYPGSDAPDEVTRTLFGGDKQAFDENKAQGGIAAHPGAFAHHLAVFTAGEGDRRVLAAARRNAALAESAGFTTVLHVVPGADHGQVALRGGIDVAVDLLYRRTGLSAP